tara:strand:+ start:93 stop:254 length:162 start_codon:yes stop_codon:yes gene_type:complete
MLYKYNNKTLDNVKLKETWMKVKQGISENYPSLKELEKNDIIKYKLYNKISYI